MCLSVLNMSSDNHGVTISYAVIILIKVLQQDSKLPHSTIETQAIGEGMTKAILTT